MRYFLVFLFLLFANNALAANPYSSFLEERFDLVETNHFYDDKESIVFVQLVFREYDPDLDRFKIQAWRMMKTHEQIKLNTKQLEEFQKFVNSKDDFGLEIQGILPRNNSLKPAYNHYTPTKDGDDYIFHFVDGDYHRKIRTRIIKTTYTTYDPELIDREFWPKESRKELMKPPSIKKKVIPLPPPPPQPTEDESVFFN